MQIHEITQRRVDEGIGTFAKSLISPRVHQQIDQRKLDKQAAKAAGKLSAQGYGADYQPASDNWQDKYKTLQTDPKVDAYASGIAAAWAKTAPTAVKPTQGLTSVATLQKMVPSLVTAAKKTNNNLTSTQIGQVLSKSAPTIWSNTADKSAAIKQLAAELAKQGVTVDKAATSLTKPATKYSYGKNPGQMSSTVAASRTGQNMQQMLGQPKGGIQDMQSDLQEAAIVGPAADQYQTAFVNWSDGQLATRVPETGATITMDNVRKNLPDLATKLQAALTQVIQTQGTPQQTQAIKDYTKLAVAGVQALAQKSKNKVSASAQQQNVQFANTSGDVKQSLRSAGIDPDKLAQFGAQAKASGNPMTARRTDNQTLNTMARLAGFTLT